MLLWLPLFLTNELQYENQSIANMQTSIEVGNLLGGAFLGFISDRCYSKRSPAGVLAVIVSFIIYVFLTINYKSISSGYLAFNLFFVGLFIGGLHHILCITCAADLGQQ